MYRLASYYYTLFTGQIDYVLMFLYDAATAEVYSLSLHDALPIFEVVRLVEHQTLVRRQHRRLFPVVLRLPHRDRKSTRLNSSHLVSSYAVFCLKKKNIPIKLDTEGYGNERNEANKSRIPVKSRHL